MPSGKVHGRAAVFLLGGYDVSSDTTSVEFDGTTAVAKSTGQGGATDETYVIGLNDSKVTAKGLFDDTAAQGLYTAFAALRDTTLVASFLPAGDTQGYAAIQMRTQIPTDAKITSPIGGVVAMDAAFQDSGVAGFGLVVTPRTALVGTGSVQNQAAPLDNGSATTNGGEANFHILQLDAATTVSPLTLQHSADNITYVDLATSGLAGTAIGADHQTVAASTTVNRYLRTASTATNTKSYKIAVTFKRS